MYQQYRLIDGKYKNIENSGRPDDVNEKILNGDYLDKSPTFTEEGEEMPFEIPSRDELMKDIFSDWKVGDKLYIGDVQLINPILDGENLRVKTREEQILQDNKIELLFDGEYVEDRKIKKVEPSEELYIPIWDKELKQWKESEASQELYEKDIDALKTQILYDGFIYTETNRATHRQRARDKDLTYLGNTIMGMEDSSLEEYTWYFDVDDTPTLSLEDLKKMRGQGTIFISSVFQVENTLKKLPPSKNINIETFKNKIDETSTVKCFK